MCGAYWKEDSELSDNLECRYLDATMEVVAEFASMLADGIYYFCRSSMLCYYHVLTSFCMRQQAFFKVKFIHVCRVSYSR